MTQSAVWWSSVRLGRCLAQVLFLLESTLAKKHYLSLRQKLFSEKVQRGGQISQNWPQVIKLTIWDDLEPCWTTLGHWQACHFWSRDVDADGIDKH